MCDKKFISVDNIVIEFFFQIFLLYTEVVIVTLLVSYV